MLATSSFIAGVEIAIVAGVLMLLIGAILRAFVQTYDKKVRQPNTAVEELRGALHRISDFLFDAPEDPLTHAPPKKGWTTQVDEKLNKILQNGNGKH